MSAVPSAGNGKITVPGILQRKFGLTSENSSPARITCLTAYDYPTARLLDEAGVDVLLVGDSLGMAVLGYESTLPVTLDEMLHRTEKGQYVAAAPPCLAGWRTCRMAAITMIRWKPCVTLVRFVKEAGAGAVKIEGGERRMELITRLVEAEIPVMGHIGLTPQSFNALRDSTCRARRKKRANNYCATRGRSKPRARLPSCWNRFRENS